MSPESAVRRSGSNLSPAYALLWLSIHTIFEWMTAAGQTQNYGALQSLGRIVYLPDVTAASDHNSDPMIFDAHNLSTIAKTSDYSFTESAFKWFDRSETFQQYVCYERGIIVRDPSDQSFGYSVSAEFTRVAGQETSVRVSEVYAKSLARRAYVAKSPEFFQFPLKPEFLEDFRYLPVIVQNPQLDHSWSISGRFMKKWGSHIVYAAFIGSIYRSWSSAPVSSDFQQWELEAKACVRAEGLDGMALQACNQYNRTQREEASKLTTYETKNLRGGTRATRSELASTPVPSREQLQKFLNENDVDDQPVQYQYLPIWDFLLDRFDAGSDDAKRALGLQAYYEGWKAHTCPVVTMSEGNKVVENHAYAQMMVPEYTDARQETGFYLCIRRCIGCHDNADCHIAFNLSCCSYGPSALRSDDGDFVKTATDWSSRSCALENGCVKHRFSNCRCDNSDKEPDCNYHYPINDHGSKSKSQKYKILWNQHSLRSDVTTRDLGSGASYVVNRAIQDYQS